MFRKLERFHSVILVTVATCLGMLGGIALDREVLAVFAQQPADSSRAAFNPGLISEAFSVIDRSYVDRGAVKPGELTYAAIAGMMDSLGDTGHSRFLTPQMAKQESNFTRGVFEGIGAQVEWKDGHTIIVAPMDGSPAQKAGLKPGDMIIEVNGENVEGQPISQVISKVSGPAGTSVWLTIQDAKTGTSRELMIVRARIELQIVTWAFIPGTRIAQIRLAAFSHGLTNALMNTLDEAQKQGATGIVLDMRNNPGGLLDESIGVASQFLKSGSVLQEQDAQGQIVVIAVKPGGVAYEIPVVVLINGGTASAAEIVAGALQDANRATVVGEKSFGTGTVLNQFSLSDGSALLLATQEWLTPAGRVIWHKGIPPDISVSMTTSDIILTPGNVQKLLPDQVLTSGDPQLLKAIAVLQGAFPAAPSPQPK